MKRIFKNENKIVSDEFTEIAFSNGVQPYHFSKEGVFYRRFFNFDLEDFCFIVDEADCEQNNFYNDVKFLAFFTPFWKKCPNQNDWTISMLLRAVLCKPGFVLKGRALSSRMQAVDILSFDTNGTLSVKPHSLCHKQSVSMAGKSVGFDESLCIELVDLLQRRESFLQSGLGIGTYVLHSDLKKQLNENQKSLAVSFRKSILKESRLMARSLQYFAEKKFYCCACLQEMFSSEYDFSRAGDKREMNNWVLCEKCIPGEKYRIKYF